MGVRPGMSKTLVSAGSKQSGVIMSTMKQRALIPPDDQMVQRAGRIYARLAWHDPSLTEWRHNVINETTSP